MNKILSIVLILISTVSFSQTLTRDKDLRLTGHINHKIFNDEADKEYPKGLMDNFTLGVQWWEFLGEPMEYYSFKWEATQVIQIDFGTFLKRSDLDKYPDLLKRFDNIRPSHLELGLSASQDLKSSYRNIKYNLEDWQILYTKAGVLSKNLSPGSPETWNEFWKWDWDMQKNYNIETEKFKTLSEEEQKKITRELRTKFRECTSLNVSVYIKDIKWPKSEINSIYEAYLQYKKDEKKPSPLEEVAEAEKEIAKETTYTKDDFWGDVAEVNNPQITLDDFPTITSSGVVELSGSIKGYNVSEVVIDGMGYSQNISLDAKGRFYGKVVLRAGENTIKLRAKNSNKTISIKLDREPVELRATLVWDGSGDIDLYMTHNGSTCSYTNKNTSGMTLDVDNTSSYGPENIYVKEASGSYAISVRNYSGATGRTATIYIFKNETLLETKDVTFSHSKEDIHIKTVKI